MSDDGGSVVLHGRGGPGGIAVHLGDLTRLAGVLAEEAKALALEAWRSRSSCTDPDLALSAPLSPTTAAAAEAAVLRAVAGPGGALGAAAAAGVLGASLEVAARAYDAAEHGVEGLWTVVDDVVGLQVGLRAPALAGIGLAGWDACHVGADVPGLKGACSLAGGTLQSTLTAHPWLVGHLVHGGGGLITGMSLWAGPAGALARPAGLPPVTTREASGGVQQLFRDGTPVVRATGPLDPDGTPVWQQDAGSVTGVGALVQSLRTTADRPGGAVDIRRVTTWGPDGRARTAYIVNIPGTDSWLPPPAQWRSRSAPDLGGNLRLVGDRSTVYSRGVLQAMERAGVPRDAPVMLVGHSEGGMTAYKIAADQSRLRAAQVAQDHDRRQVHGRGPAQPEAFHITHVVTAGSPIATMTRPEGVHVLSLEASGDIVKDLDGAPNPDRLDHLTYEFDLDRHRITLNHAIDGYAAAAAAVDRAAAQRDAGAAGFVASLRRDGFVADTGEATVATQGWTVDRAVG